MIAGSDALLRCISLDLRFAHLPGGSWPYVSNVIPILIREHPEITWRLYYNAWSPPQQEILNNLHTEFTLGHGLGALRQFAEWSRQPGRHDSRCHETDQEQPTTDQEALPQGAAYDVLGRAHRDGNAPFVVAVPHHEETFRR